MRRGSARTPRASLARFRRGVRHYQDEGLRRATSTDTTMVFPGDTEETAVTEFPQPPAPAILRHLAPYGLTRRSAEPVRR
ncbi:hypothetical protein [Nocardia sp. CA-290969]|uniref:hypothetical protein n=1 Tax=Nocardia sp. CA-290969 TaxID=3239986 RepID=UPI003D8B3791